MTLHEIIELADRLPPDEREQLIAHLTGAPPAEADFPLTEAQKRLLDQRLAEHEANPGAGIPWEELKAQLRRGV